MEILIIIESVNRFNYDRVYNRIFEIMEEKFDYKTKDYKELRGEMIYSSFKNDEYKIYFVGKETLKYLKNFRYDKIFIDNVVNLKKKELFHIRKSNLKTEGDFIKRL